MIEQAKKLFDFQRLETDEFSGEFLRPEETFERRQVDGKSSLVRQQRRRRRRESLQEESVATNRNDDALRLLNNHHVTVIL